MVKAVTSNTSKSKDLLDAAIFQTLEHYPANLIDTPNHATCHFISCPVFLAMLPIFFLSPLT
jgi:hypothetical protein